MMIVYRVLVNYQILQIRVIVMMIVYRVLVNYQILQI